MQHLVKLSMSEQAAQFGSEQERREQERREQALVLKKSNWSVNKIAFALGVTRGPAQPQVGQGFGFAAHLATFV
jgi:hypothetical protein